MDMSPSMTLKRAERHQRDAGDEHEDLRLPSERHDSSRCIAKVSHRGLGGGTAIAVAPQRLGAEKLDGTHTAQHFD